MKLSVLLTLGAGSLLAGCMSTVATDLASRYYEIGPTSTVVVQQDIKIPPGFAHVILQGAKIVGTDTLRRYEPYCEIEVNDVVDREQIVRPGRFAVSRVVRQQQMTAASAPVLLAGNRVSGVGFGMGMATRTGLNSDSGGPSFTLSAVHLWLTSAEQPNVRELRCAGGWAYIPYAVYPTLAEMRNALGSFVSLEIH